MKKTKRFKRSAVSLTMAAVLCASSLTGISTATVSAAESDGDFARGDGVVTMADCPLYMQGEIQQNPNGSYLKVNDGDDASGWKSRTYDDCLHKEHWIYVDFIETKTFDQIKIIWDESAYATKYKVQVSNSGRDSDWHDRVVVSDNTNGGEVIHDFEQSTARFVRIYIEESVQEDAVVGINTISVYQAGADTTLEDVVAKDIEWLTDDVVRTATGMYPEITNPDLQNVKSSLNLPKTGFASSDISWNVSPDNGNINLENGDVTRGQEDQNYTLTATVSKGEVSETKEFNVTVKANVVVGAELKKGIDHNYLTVGGSDAPMPYVVVQNCGMQQYCTLDKTLEEKLAMEENLFEKTAQLGYKRIGIIFKWKDWEPTTAGEYDWRIVDKYIEWCNKYDLYWDIVYFGSNSCGGSRLTDGNVSGGEWWLGNLPKYVDRYKGYFDYGVHSGAPMVKCPELKGSNYEYIKSNEIRAIQDLMDHLAATDTNKRTACFQVMNEPYWHEASQAYWKNGYQWKETNAGEDRWIYDWISDVAVAIKASDYSVPTRINGSAGAYDGVQYTWLNNLPGIDFVGDDIYNNDLEANRVRLTEFLAGSSFPHVAENYGSANNTSSLVLNTMMYGGGYHGWQLSPHFGDSAMTGDNYNNWVLGQPANWRESGQDMMCLNPAMNRISSILATASLEALAAFNIEQNNPLASYKDIKIVQGIYAGYECDDASVAMAVKDEKAVYLVSDSASTGNGKVNFLTRQQPVSASYGELDENGQWVVSEELTSSKGEDGIYRIPVKKGECIRVEFEEVALPQLKNLTLTAGELNPAFNTSIHEYNLNVGADVSELRLTAEVEGKDAKFQVDGVEYAAGSTSLPAALQFGDNEIAMNVVWESIGAVRENTYTIHVNRGVSENITAAEVASGLQSIPPLGEEQTSITFPQVPAGFDIGIESSSDENVIALDGKVTPSALDQVIMLSLRVTNPKNNEDTAATRALPVKVTAKADTPQNINLTLKKPVTASNGTAEGSTEYVVDGNYGTRWVSPATFPQNLVIDLGSVMEFNQMVTNWDTAYCSKYRLLVSDDNEHWSEALAETNHPNVIGSVVNNFETVSGRYVKFEAIKNGPNAGVYAIMELELYNRKLISEDYVLQNIELSAGNDTLSPAFDSDTYYYTAAVGTETDSLTLTPFQNGADAAVEVNGEKVNSGEPSGAIALESGDNKITVFVQDPVNKDCTATYEIHVIKKNYSLEQGYTNAILKKPVSVLTNNGFWHPAAQINDGDLAKFAQPSGGALPKYQFDLKGTFTLDQFRIYTGATNLPVNFDVKTSLDGSNWTVVKSVRNYASTSGIYDLEPVNANYVQLELLPGSSGTAGINEVEFYGVSNVFSAKAIAENIKNLEVTVGQKQLNLPKVPESYSVRVKTSSNEDVINLDGVITASDTYQQIEVTLEVSGGKDDVAMTKAITVNVPPTTLTCANVVADIFSRINPIIPKDVTSMKLPEPPAGFSVTYNYVEGVKNLLSFNGNQLTIIPQRTNSGANYSLTVSNGSESATSEGWMIFEVPGRSPTAQELIDELSVETTQKGGSTMILPQTEGYKVVIESSSNQSVIDVVGNIAEIESTTNVKLYLKATKLDDGTIAYRTVTITVLSSADNSELIDLVSSYETYLYKEEAYTPESFRPFQTAMAEARRVMGEASATQQQIDAAVEALTNAAEALEEIMDKTLLKELYDACKDMVQGSYTDETWEAFDVARTHAAEVLEDPGADIAAIDQVWMDLFMAKQNLKEVVNKELLIVTIELGEKADTSNCTPESVQKLEEALEEARKVNEDPAATEEQVKKAIEAVMEALQQLTEMADRTRLQQLTDMAGQLTEEKYTPSTWNAMNSMYENALKILENVDATQVEVDKAYNDLAKALMGLTDRANKINLETAIGIAEKIVENSDSYVTSTIEGLDKLLGEAELVLNDGEANQNDVDDMAKKLQDAASKSRKKADKRAVIAAVQMADEVNPELYTKESIDLLSVAVDEAALVIKNEELSEDDQEQVDQAAENVFRAMNTLVKKENAGDNSNVGGGTDGTDGKDQTNNGSQTTDTSKNQSGANKASTVKTGDENTAFGSFMLAFIFAGAAGTFTLFLRRKSKNR